MISTLKRPLRATVLITLTALTGLAQKPELVVQTGHSDQVNSVAFSPDGKTLASGSLDHTIKLWDVTSGMELRPLKGHTSQVVAVAFSPNGKTLASGSLDYTIKLWDVLSGTEFCTLKGHAESVHSVAFSPDGKTLASGSRDDTIKLWDVSNGIELRTFNGHSAWLPSMVFGPGLNSVTFSPDGKTLASGSDDHTIKLWDVLSGTGLFTLKGHSSAVISVAFSPDGKTLASGSYDQTVKLWDVSTGTEVRTFKGHSGVVMSVAFDTDGKTLASGSRDHTTKLWEVSTGAELRALKGHSNVVESVMFSPDGKMLASGSWDRTIKLWDGASGTELRTLKGLSSHVNSVAFSADRKTLASGTWDYAIKLWDVPSGAELRTLIGHSSMVDSVAFSADGKTLASGGWDNAINLWDVSSGTKVSTLPRHSYSVSSMAFSADGKTLASGGWDNAINLWDVSSGTELNALRGHSSSVVSAAFSPNGKTLATGSGDQTIKLWDVSIGTELHTLKGHSNAVNSVAFSPDGKTLASGSNDHTVKLWDITSGTELRTLIGHSSLVSSVAFSPDGKTLASGGYDKTIRLWDVSIGTELRTLMGHSNVVASVAFSPDGKMLASGSWDTYLKLWRVSDGAELASLVALDEKDWAVVTPSGLFDGSINAWNRLAWRLDNKTFSWAPVEAFFNEFYYPGLLGEIIDGKQPTPPKRDLSSIDIRQPQVRITRVDGQAVIRNTLGQPGTVANPANNRTIEVTLEVTENVQSPSRLAHPKTSGARDVRLFRNGSLVKLWPGDTFRNESKCARLPAQESSGPRRSACTVTIPLVSGENRLTAYAFNHDDVKSTDASLTITGADSLKRKGIAYVLAVGVNEYSNSQYNLKYAVADARDFAAELKLRQANLNNYERVDVISLKDRDATKANILKSLADLSAKVQPEDALVIYFAGHGTAQQNRFYLIPHDLGYMGSRTRLNRVGLRTILSHSISDEELERAVEGIDAGQMLLVIDACNSGQALEAEEKRRGPMNSKGLAQLAYEKGMYILTAAQSYQAALEASRLGHGYLTYALIEEGLRTGAADKQPKDGQVLLREWLDYATERVPQMQQDELDNQKKKGRQLDRIKFAESDSGNERSIQRPRVFYRRETETHPLVVAKP